jgi:hypothetical protein
MRKGRWALGVLLAGLTAGCGPDRAAAPTITAEPW